jgi:hypothetical protein
MKINLVGSAIHGNLLKPNDKDITIETKSLREFKSLAKILGAKIHRTKLKMSVATVRHGDLNIILLNRLTTKQYVSGMDVNLVRGFINGETGKSWLTTDAKLGLKNKVIKFLPRGKEHIELFGLYDELESDRKAKYVNKVPKGFTFIVEG